MALYEDVSKAINAVKFTEDQDHIEMLRNLYAQDNAVNFRAALVANAVTLQLNIVAQAQQNEVALTPAQVAEFKKKIREKIILFTLDRYNEDQLNTVIAQSDNAGAGVVVAPNTVWSNARFNFEDLTTQEISKIQQRAEALKQAKAAKIQIDTLKNNPLINIAEGTIAAEYEQSKLILDRFSYSLLIAQLKIERAKMDAFPRSLRLFDRNSKRFLDEKIHGLEGKLSDITRRFNQDDNNKLVAIWNLDGSNTLNNIAEFSQPFTNANISALELQTYSNRLLEKIVTFEEYHSNCSAKHNLCIRTKQRLADQVRSLDSDYMEMCNANLDANIRDLSKKIAQTNTDANQDAPEMVGSINSYSAIDDTNQARQAFNNYKFAKHIVHVSSKIGFNERVILSDASNIGSDHASVTTKTTQQPMAVGQEMVDVDTSHAQVVNLKSNEVRQARLKITDNTNTSVIDLRQNHTGEIVSHTTHSNTNKSQAKQTALEWEAYKFAEMLLETYTPGIPIQIKGPDTDEAREQGLRIFAALLLVGNSERFKSLHDNKGISQSDIEPLIPGFQKPSWAYVSVRPNKWISTQLPTIYTDAAKHVKEHALEFQEKLKSMKKTGQNTSGQGHISAGYVEGEEVTATPVAPIIRSRP